MVPHEQNCLNNVRITWPAPINRIHAIRSRCWDCLKRHELSSQVNIKLSGFERPVHWQMSGFTIWRCLAWYFATYACRSRSLPADQRRFIDTATEGQKGELYQCTVRGTPETSQANARRHQGRLIFIVTAAVAAAAAAAATLWWPRVCRHACWVYVVCAGDSHVNPLRPAASCAAKRGV